MSDLRRGFKTWCENAARGYRRELGLKSVDALDPRRLASYLNVKVWIPADVPGVPAKALRQLTEVDPSSWSAVTVCIGTSSLIITNNRHSLERQNNSIMHELSHLVLKHKPAQAFVLNTGEMMINNYDKMQEQEADCLSGTLLVPREALLFILQKNPDQHLAASHFKVTDDVLRMRLNLTGVGKQLASRQRFRSA
ncbi:MAG: ImmA/IrrE family metallo-endopeptidase [Pseudomonadota bacterium]